MRLDPSKKALGTTCSFLCNNFFTVESGTKTQALGYNDRKESPS